MEASERRSTNAFRKTVMNNKGEDQREDLETAQNKIEKAGKKVAHTHEVREKEVRRTLEKARTREGAGASCTQAIKRRCSGSKQGTSRPIMP